MIPTLAQLFSAGSTLIQCYPTLLSVPSELSISERPYSCKSRPCMAASRTSAVSHIDIWSWEFPWGEVLDLLWLKKCWNFHIIPYLERGDGVEDLTSKARALKLKSCSPACALLLIPEIAGSAIHMDTFKESTEELWHFFSWVGCAWSTCERHPLTLPKLMAMRRQQSSKMPVTYSCLSILQQRQRDQAALGF